MTVWWTDCLATALVFLGRAEEAVALVDNLPADHEELRGSELRQQISLALVLLEYGHVDDARRLLEGTFAKVSRLREKRRPSRMLRSSECTPSPASCSTGGPALPPGLFLEDRPAPSFTIEAPFRTMSPVADGRINPGEYGARIPFVFDNGVNPGRLFVTETAFTWTGPTSDAKAPGAKAPDDLSGGLHAAYSDQSLFLAFSGSGPVCQCWIGKGSRSF